MIKKPVFPRILLIFLLYGAVFMLLVMIQFARQGSFTQRVGNFIVSGQYRHPEVNSPSLGSNEYLIGGETSVFFGGMEFCMGSEHEASTLRLIRDTGESEEVLPDRMTLSGESAKFYLPGGTELTFITQYTGGALELRVSCNFAEGVAELELPYRPLRRTGARDSGDGQFVIISDGVNYSFGKSPLDAGRQVLFLKAGGLPLSYKVVPEKKAFNPADFIILQAQTDRNYKTILNRWTDENFSFWNRTVTARSAEDLIIALAGEALMRGTYKAAMSSIPAGFTGGSQRTHESTVYLGGLMDTYRFLDSTDREKIARLLRLINEKSLDFLKEPHVFEFFAVRGHGNFIDEGAALIHSIDPATLALDLTPGILEGYMDWKIYRPLMDNPFERLVDQACFIISESLRMNSDGNKVFAFYGSQSDGEFNLRLGRALLEWADSANDASWAGVARSLILSVLSLSNNSGSARAGYTLNDGGEMSENVETPELSTARLYRILNPGAYAPKALSIGSPVNSMWAWTAAQTVSASQENNILDISVTFSAGESHYMIIRGIRPFTKIQLYGMDFRTDPQFERYDSSGWSYAASEQTLLLKMKHRGTIEHVRVFY